MIASPKETGVGCLMILSSVPVYGLFIAWKNKPKAFQRLMGAFNQKLQKLLMVVRPKSSQV